MMRLIHYLPSLARSQGGPVAGLCDLLDPCPPPEDPPAVVVLSTRLADEATPTALPAHVETRSFAARHAFGFRYSGELRRFLDRPGNFEGDVLHSHLLWTHGHRLTSRAAARHGLPHLVSPCGTLDPSALRHRGLKKALIGRLFQRKILLRAACLHAQSEHERAALAAYAPGRPIALIPGSVKAATPDSSVACTAFRRTHGIPPEARLFLFLGRLHPVKNLPALLRAWASLSSVPAASRWHGVFAGPDAAGHRVELENLARELGLTQRLHFTGWLGEAEKRAALTTAEFLVLPSHFESFGYAAAEALALGRPVLASDRTPWSRLPQKGAGFWIDRSPASLAVALESLFSTSPKVLRAMGARGPEILHPFAPSTVAAAWAEVYRWLVSGGVPPGCVSGVEG